MIASAKSCRVLVTGAAGFIGYHVSEKLLAAGHTVFGLDNLSDYYDPRLKEMRLERLHRQRSFRFDRLDVADYAGVARLMQRVTPEVVIHLAAQAGVRYSLVNPRAYLHANLDGFLSILEACRYHKVSHLIYASSSSVYGANGKLPFSEHDIADHPVSLYAATKRSNELMAHAYAHLFGIPATGLRFFTVYGPWGRPDMAYWTFTAAVQKGEPIKLFNQGNMRRDFTYIDDVTDAILPLLNFPPAADPSFDLVCPDPATSSAPHRIYNIGNHTPVELTRFIEVIEKAVGKKAIKEFVPMQAGDMPATYADVDDLAAAVDFSPRVPIEEGIPRFVEWYRMHYSDR